MCLRLNYYPLVEDIDGNKKILFTYAVHVNDDESFNDMMNIQKECRYANIGASKYQSLNALFKKEKFTRLVKMVSIPCGQCAECLKTFSREWAFRIHLEALSSNDNYFVTFTYDDDHLPSNHMLVSDEISNFNKKLKVYLNRNNLDSSFRFYGVGEYGSLYGRPHYHVIYFGLPLNDLEYHSTTPNGDILYTSKFLSDVWSKGIVIIGSVEIGSACYVARYCDKKKRLSKKDKLDLIDKGIVPEYSVMSRRPGIGALQYENLKTRFITGDYQYFIDGNSYNIPVAWLKKLKVELGEDSIYFEDYNYLSRINSSVKVNHLLNISRFCDLDLYLDSKDVIKTSRKL